MIVVYKLQLVFRFRNIIDKTVKDNLSKLFWIYDTI